MTDQDTDEQTIEDLERQLRDREASYNALECRYGTGVRPGWVSTDLSLEGAVIAALKARIAAMKIGAE